MNSLQLKDRYEVNEQIACANRKDLDAAGVTAVAVVGPPGSGKSSLIEEVLLRIAPPFRAAVIIGDLAADRQVSQIRRHGYQAIPVITDNLTASHVRAALARFDLTQFDLLFIEASGHEVNSVDFDFGHHLQIGVFSAGGGDDKVKGFPYLVAGADLVLLTKVDLMSLVTFDLDVFCHDVHSLKPGLDVIRTSVRHNEGIDVLSKWLEFHTQFDKRASSTPRLFHPFANYS